MTEAPVHYVKNKDLTDAMREWRITYYLPWKERKKKAKEEGKKFTELQPPITEYMGQCYYLIAKKYARKPNWSGYTYVEDMISESVLLCIKYAHNFDTDKSNNAFSYFTQIVHNGFLQAINRENKFSKFKFQMIKDNNEKFGKLDYNDIILEDEDNIDLVKLNADVEDIDTGPEPNYNKIADDIAKEESQKLAAEAKAKVIEDKKLADEVLDEMGLSDDD